MDRRVIFSGYILIRTDEIEEIYRKIKDCKYIYRFLKTEDEFCTIEPNEIEHIRNMADASGIIGISKVLTIGDNIVVMSGPLVNYHGSRDSAAGHRKNRNPYVVYGQH